MTRAELIDKLVLLGVSSGAMDEPVQLDTGDKVYTIADIWLVDNGFTFAVNISAGKELE